MIITILSFFLQHPLDGITKENENGFNKNYIAQLMEALELDSSKTPEELFLELAPKAEKGDASAQGLLCMLHMNNGEVGSLQRGDVSQALPWCEKAVEQGDANGQFVLGALYYIGRGVPRDRKKTVNLWSKAAEQKHVHAQYFLGIVFEHGVDNKKDYVKAYQLYYLSHKNGCRFSLSAIKQLSTRMTKEQINEAMRRVYAVTN